MFEREKSHVRTQQCPNNFKVAVEEIVEDAQNNTPECLFGVTHGSCRKYIEIGGRRTIVVESPHGWFAKDIIGNGNLLEGTGSVGVIRKFTVKSDKCLEGKV